MRTLALILALSLGSCTGPGHAKVGGVLLAQADSATLTDAQPRTMVVMADRGSPVPALSESSLNLALSWDLPWSEVNRILTTFEKAGKQVHLVVGKQDKLAIFQLEDSFDDYRVLRLNDQGSGKACLTAPNVKQGKCVQGYEKKHIDRAGVREIVREGVKSLGIEAVEAEVWPETLWGDVVRLIDGARTCCAGRQIKVKLSPASRRL